MQKLKCPTRMDFFNIKVDLQFLPLLRWRFCENFRYLLIFDFFESINFEIISSIILNGASFFGEMVERAILRIGGFFFENFFMLNAVGLNIRLDGVDGTDGMN